MISYHAILSQWDTLTSEQRYQYLTKRAYSVIDDGSSAEEKALLAQRILQDDFCNKEYFTSLSSDLQIPLSRNTFNTAIKDPSLWPLLELSVNYYSHHDKALHDVLISAIIVYGNFSLYLSSSPAFLSYIYTASRELQLSEHLLNTLLRVHHPFIVSPLMRETFLTFFTKNVTERHGYSPELLETIATHAAKDDALHLAIQKVMEPSPLWTSLYYLYCPERGTPQQRQKAILHFWAKDMPPYYTRVDDLLSVVKGLNWPNHIDNLTMQVDILSALEMTYGVDLLACAERYSEQNDVFEETTGVTMSLLEYVMKNTTHEEIGLHL